MTTLLFVKPAAEGTVVRQYDHDMRPLANDGEWVADSNFWRARILNGDVVEAPPPPQDPKAKADR